MARKAFNVKSRIISQLRQLSRYAPMRGEAMRAAKVGYGQYKCNACSGTFSPSFVKVDHIQPVVPTSGWVGWDDYISRLFCDPSGLQVLCETCHDVKTKDENSVRKICRALAKKVARDGT